MKYLISTIGVLILLLGCQDTSQKPENGTASTTEDSTYLKPGFEYVQQIPDSLRTPQQKELVRKLARISVEHVKVIDNRMVFDMSKEEFLRTGIPVEYYELFQRNMEDNNRYIKKHDIKNVDKMVEKFRRNTRKLLEEGHK